MMPQIPTSIIPKRSPHCPASKLFSLDSIVFSQEAFLRQNALRCQKAPRIELLRNRAAYLAVVMKMTRAPHEC
jgi:hypothetical protein